MRPKGICITFLIFISLKSCVSIYWRPGDRLRQIFAELYGTVFDSNNDPVFKTIDDNTKILFPSESEEANKDESSVALERENIEQEEELSVDITTTVSDDNVNRSLSLTSSSRTSTSTSLFKI